jgi:ligand-binding sensor domain-containing protein
MGTLPPNRLSMPKRLQIILLCAIFGVTLTAQDLQVRHFTEKDGLPSSHILSIFKDSHGLLWIGTDAALCTYNGYEFSVLTTREGKTIDNIWSIAEDKKGNLWFGSNGNGIYRYDGHEFFRFTTDNGLSDNNVRFLYYSARFDLIAACSYQGANIIRGDSVVRSPEFMGTADHTFTLTKALDGDDFILFTALGWINPTRYYPAQNKFVCINDKGVRYPNAAVFVYITSGGDTVFSEYPRGIRILARSGMIREPSIGQVFNMDEDKHGNLWMASWSFKNRDLTDGVFRYDGQKFVNFKEQLGIKDKSIWTVMCDRDQDHVWVGTETEGLFWFRSSEISQKGPLDLGLEELHINHLYIDSGDTLWISDQRELLRQDPGGQVTRVEKRPMILAFQEYWKEPRRNVFVTIDSIQRALRTMPVSKFAGFEREIPFEFGNILEVPGQGIYFSNRFGLFSTRNGRTEYHGSEGSEGVFNFISPDTIVLAGLGQSVINPRFRNKSANITINQKPDNTYMSKASGFIQFDKKGNPQNINTLDKRDGSLWYSSWTSGLWRSEGLRLVNLNKSDSTINKNIADLCFDRLGHLIFASRKGDVSIAKITGENLETLWRIMGTDGLLGNTVNWLQVSPDNHLWVGTNLGLNCINLNKLYDTGKTEIRIFDKEEGYTGQGSASSAIDSKGILFVAGENSLIRVNTARLLSDTVKQRKVVLRGVKINGSSVSDQMVRDLNHGTLLNDLVRVQSDQSDFVFYFDVLNYFDSGKDLFRYKLEGHSEQWSEWSIAREAVFTNLPHGRYHLQVESRNQSTLVNAEPLSVEVMIPPAFWHRWYNRVLAFLLLVGLIFFITIKIVDKRRLEQISRVEMKRKVLELEMKALQNQMNPHFVYNSLSGIQHSILEQNTEEALGYISDFSKVMRISLENASSTFIPLVKEIEFLNSYLRLEQMRFSGLFDYQIINRSENQTVAISIPSMMIQPFAENSIRHGFAKLQRKGVLTIEFELIQPETIKCTITDNGRGRANAAKLRPIKDKPERVHSTGITEMRIQLFNQPGEPEKFKIIYTDLAGPEGPSGLKVELILPAN